MNGVARIKKTSVSIGDPVIVTAGFSQILIYLGAYAYSTSARAIANVTWDGRAFTQVQNRNWQVGGDPIWLKYAIYYLLNPTPKTGTFSVNYGLGVVLQFANVDQDDPIIDSDGTNREAGGTGTTPNIDTDYPRSYGVGVGVTNTANTPTISSDNAGMVTERSGNVSDYGFAMASVLNDAATVDFTIHYGTESVGVAGAVLRYKEQILASPLWF